MKPLNVMLVESLRPTESTSPLRQRLEYELGVRNSASNLKILSYPFSQEVLTSTISEVQPMVFVLLPADQTEEQLLSLVDFTANKLPGMQMIGVGSDVAEKAAKKLTASAISDVIFSVLTADDPVDLCGRQTRPGDFDEAVENHKTQLGLSQLIGESPAFVSEINKIPNIAKFDVNILISGETGTGKELVARAIHYLSGRTCGPFIPINCGAIPVDLIENELFGHKQGAYTAAVTSEHGLIKEADGGTLFLDEVGSLPLSAQVKLLRFLQEKEFRPLGSAKSCKSDVRIIAATNTDLRGAMEVGAFRQDLYYRLNVVNVDLPPLRERHLDIALLSRHFLAKYAAQFNKSISALSPDALELLLLYNWPGNVRELEHVIVRAVVLAKGPIIKKTDISLRGIDDGDHCEGLQAAKNKFVAWFEKNYIETLLLNFRGNVTKAAKAAHKDRRSFWHLVKKHNIVVQTFRELPHNVNCLPH